MEFLSPKNCPPRTPSRNPYQGFKTTDGQRPRGPRKTPRPKSLKTPRRNARYLTNAPKPPRGRVWGPELKTPCIPPPLAPPTRNPIGAPCPASRPPKPSTSAAPWARGGASPPISVAPATSVTGGRFKITAEMQVCRLNACIPATDRPGLANAGPRFATLVLRGRSCEPGLADAASAPQLQSAESRAQPRGRILDFRPSTCDPLPGTPDSILAIQDSWPRPMGPMFRAQIRAPGCARGAYSALPAAPEPGLAIATPASRLGAPNCGPRP